MRALLDTSVLIGAEDPGALEGAVSAVCLVELHFGVLVAGDEDERARRALRLGVIESTFEPLPIDAAVAREWGRTGGRRAHTGGTAAPARARSRHRRNRQRPRRPAAHPQRERPAADRRPRRRPLALARRSRPPTTRRTARRSSVEPPMNVIAVIGARKAARIRGPVGVPAADQLSQPQRPLDGGESAGVPARRAEVSRPDRRRGVHVAADTTHHELGRLHRRRRSARELVSALAVSHGRYRHRRPSSC